MLVSFYLLSCLSFIKYPVEIAMLMLIATDYDCFSTFIRLSVSFDIDWHWPPIKS